MATLTKKNDKEVKVREDHAGDANVKSPETEPPIKGNQTVISLKIWTSYCPTV